MIVSILLTANHQTLPRTSIVVRTHLSRTIEEAETEAMAVFKSTHPEAEWKDYTASGNEIDRDLIRLAAEQMKQRKS